MKLSLLALPVIIGIIVLVSVPNVLAQSDETGEIPSWIKGITNFWVQGEITDTVTITDQQKKIDFLEDALAQKNLEYEWLLEMTQTLAGNNPLPIMPTLDT